MSNKETTEMPIKLTESAVAQLKTLSDKESPDKRAFRLFINGYG